MIQDETKQQILSLLQDREIRKELVEILSEVNNQPMVIQPLTKEFAKGMVRPIFPRFSLELSETD